MDEDLFQLAQKNCDELKWAEIERARNRKVQELRHKSETSSLKFSAVSFGTDEEIEKMRTLPHEEAVLYRQELIRKYLKHQQLNRKADER